MLFRQIECVRGRGKLKIPGRRGLYYSEKILRRADREGVGNVVSNRPTFERIAAASPVRGYSVRVTFTLQRCYRISRRRCNRCNLCFVLRASAYGLRYIYMYMYTFYIDNA